jgi:hypothetical protein
MDAIYNENIIMSHADTIVALVNIIAERFYLNGVTLDMEKDTISFVEELLQELKISHRKSIEKVRKLKKQTSSYTDQDEEDDFS